jgi:hypothetical protein
MKGLEGPSFSDRANLDRGMQTMTNFNHKQSNNEYPDQVKAISVKENSAGRATSKEEGNSTC